MIDRAHRRGFMRTVRDCRRGAVSIIFATAIIPLAMSVGLAVDYGFYIQALAQTTMAADAAAIHAVRVAVTTFNSGASSTVAGQAGGQAGLQWFKAQLGTLVTGAVPAANISVFPPGGSATCPSSPCVGFDQSTGTFSTSVSYQLNVPTHFGGLFHIPLWTTQQVASSAVTANAFVEVLMMLDTSASMSIGTTATDMLKIEELTVCMPQALAQDVLGGGDQADLYRFLYTPSTMGYAPNSSATPTSASHAGACDSRYLNIPEADQRLCQATPTIISTYQYPGIPLQDNGVPRIVNANGYCPPNTGWPDTSSPPKRDSLNKNAVANLPIATCALSCHDNNNNQDLSGLVTQANANGAGISIRLNVVTAAAAKVVTTLINKEAALGLPNQFSVGVGEINSTTGQQDYPKSTGAFVEAGTDLNAALTAVNAIQPTNDSTDIDDLLISYASLAKPSGTGGTSVTPRKNIFLVTDGLQDNLRGGPAGTRWSTVNPANCATLKSMGYTIFVLYTPYYPLPHHQYLDSIMQLSEPLVNSQITAALSACATTSTSSAQYFFQASSATDIDTAMTTMLNLALNQPATITH